MAGETLSAPDDADFEEAISTRSRTINVALIGNPNSGKTSLFNAISGGHEHVGNYSGVTVDAKRGEYRYGGYRFVITDLPGTYALSAYTPEELYVRRHLVNDTPDVVVNAGFPAGDTPVAPEVVAADAIPADKMGLDIGPDSQKLFHDKIVDSKTVVWNGPMGVFEVPEFAAGTKAVAQALVDATAAGAFTIVGGGDSASAVRNLGFPEDGFSHISTGGGASLEFLEGKELPGLKVLD